MATTGEVFPTSGTSVAESPWLDNAWTTPGAVAADDGSVAYVTATTFDSNDQTYVLKASGFDFSALYGATINGVTVRVNAYGDGDSALDLCQLLDTTGAKVGTNKCATQVALPTTTSNVVTLGGAADLWGNALTDTWVMNSNFGVALGAKATAANAQVFVDYVTIEIDYTPGVPTIVRSPTSLTFEYTIP